MTETTTETTHETTIITTDQCVCYECVGKNKNNCKLKNYVDNDVDDDDDDGGNGNSGQITPVYCDVGENCTSISITEKKGSLDGFVRKCYEPCVVGATINCSAVFLDIYLDPQLQDIANNIENYICQITNCDCPLEPIQFCKNDTSSTVDTSDMTGKSQDTSNDDTDYTADDDETEKADGGLDLADSSNSDGDDDSSLIGDDRGVPACRVCTGIDWKDCKKAEIIQPCPQENPVCLEKEEYLGGIIVSVERACTNFGDPRILSNNDFANCQLNDGPVCYTASPTRDCAEGEKMCPSKKPNVICNLCNGVSQSACRAGSPTVCPSPTAVCVLRETQDSKGNTEEIVRECSTLDYCMSNGLNLNRRLETFSDNSTRQYETCERPTKCSARPPVDYCEYEVCEVCDVDREANCVGIPVLCEASEEYCRVEQTILSRGTPTRFRRFCAMRSECPTSLFPESPTDFPGTCSASDGFFCEARCEYKTCSNTTETPTTPRPPDAGCSSSPCMYNSTCLDKDGGGYECFCPPNYRGVNCDEPVPKGLYKYGPDYGHDYLRGLDDDNSPRIQLNYGFSMGDHRGFKLYINMNGYVTFDVKYINPFPALFPLTGKNSQVDIIAPMWMDLDSSGSTDDSTGTIYYRVYERLVKNDAVSTGDSHMDDVFGQVRTDIEAAEGDGSFSPNLVVVITWVNVVPFYYEDNVGKEKLTFQLVLAQDYTWRRSYMIFLYEEIDVNDATRNTVQGFQASENFWAYITTSMTSSFPLLPSLGNYGCPGRYVFKTSTSDVELLSESYESQCWEWHYQEDQSIGADIRLYNIWLPICPCTFTDAFWDGNFITDFDTGCAYTIGLYGRTYAKKCCYNRFPQTMFGYDILLTNEDYEGGSMLRYNPFYWSINYLRSDQDPKDWCCLYSDNCQYFYSVRPISTCDGYIPPFLSWLWGDPHVATLDGISYTFNGLGEFWLIKSPTLQIQGRTYEWQNDAGLGTGGTSWEAVAVFDNTTLSGTTASVSSNRIFIGLNEAKNALIIKVVEANIDLSDWFNTDPNSVNIRVETGATFVKSNGTVLVKLPSGALVGVRIESGQIALQVTAPDDLKKENSVEGGLLGKYNGDPSDDFTLPDGTELSLTNSSSQEAFYNFGIQWRIETKDSIFYYEDGKDALSYTYPDFTPVFTDNLDGLWTSPEQKATAEGLCQGDQECLSDYFLTGNSEVAKSTKNTNEENIAIREILENIIPVIKGPKSVQVAIGEVSTIVLSVNNTERPVTIKPLFFLPDGATFDTDSMTFRWNVTDHVFSPFDMKFGGFDDLGNKAVELEVTVILCNCSIEFGSCPFDEDELVAGFNFRVAICDCNPPYDGDVCEDDKNYCVDDPCPLKCNDLTPQEQVNTPGQPGFECIGCQKGYKEFIDLTDNNKTKCKDIDECMEGTDACDSDTSLCENKAGSYICTCKPGFKPLEGNITHCENIDECLLGTDTCDHFCTDTDGSYSCTCRTGYTLQANICEPDQATVTACESLGCEIGCSETSSGSGDFQCFCMKGYRVDPDNATLCIDINECNSNTTNECHPKATCDNAPGTYSCECQAGYTLDDDQRGCTACELLRYGPNCALLCDKCFNSSYCNNEVGCTLCEDGWTGAACDQNINECAADVNPCGNNSICVDTQGTFRCSCKAGYTLKTIGCVEINECEATDGDGMPYMPCGLTGTCTDEFRNFTCECVAGYSGRTCDINIDDCVDATCRHGGICQDHVNTYSCECQGGYYGSECQYFDCSPVNVTVPTRHRYNGTMRIINRDFGVNMADSNSDEALTLTQQINRTLTRIYACIYEGTRPLFVSIENITFAPGSVWASWYLILSGEVDPTTLEFAIINNTFALDPLEIDFTTVSYQVYPFEPSPGLPYLAIILGTVGGIVFICLLVLIIVYIAYRCRDSNKFIAASDTDSRSESENVKPFWLPRFGRLHWMSAPSTMKSDHFPTPSTSSSEYSDDTYGPRIPRPRMVQPVPNIDWSVLKNFSRRFGYGGAMPAARPVVEPGRNPFPPSPDHTLQRPTMASFPQVFPRPAVIYDEATVHRETPPYRKRGDFYWIPSDMDQHDSDSST